MEANIPYGAVISNIAFVTYTAKCTIRVHATFAIFTRISRFAEIKDIACFTYNSIGTSARYLSGR
jgi:hypothetical protein